MSFSISEAGYMKVGGLYILRERLFFLYSPPAAGASYFQRLGAAFATTGYQAPAAGYRIVAVLCASFSGAFQVTYGDNDVGYSSASAPTNVTYLGGISTGAAPIFDTTTNPRSKAWIEVYATIPANKYAYGYGSGSASGSAIWACETL